MNLDGLFADPQVPTRIAFQALSMESRNAFKQEILPQLTDIDSVRDLAGTVGEVTLAISEAARAKDTLYTRLIRHKAIDQVDDSFFSDILVVLSQWAKQQAKADRAPAPAPAPAVAPAPPPAPVPVPVQQVVQPVMQPLMQPVMQPVMQPMVMPQVDPVQSLREDIANQLAPSQNVTPWDLAQSLQTVFQQHGVRQANAAVRSRSSVSVGFGTFGIADMELEHRPGRGWFTAIGFGPKTAAQEIMVRMAKAG
jgi:hypothetical protein